MALWVGRDGPAAGQGQLDVAAVENQDALEVERLQSLTPAHRTVIVTLNGPICLEPLEVGKKTDSA